MRNSSLRPGSWSANRSGSDTRRAFERADTGPSLGGAITVELASRFALEGSCTYVDRGAGATALNVQAGVVANLITTKAQVLPFIAAGAGGMRINLTPHVFIRPEVRRVFVVADNAVQTLGAGRSR